MLLLVLTLLRLVLVLPPFGTAVLLLFALLFSAGDAFFADSPLLLLRLRPQYFQHPIYGGSTSFPPSPLGVGSASVASLANYLSRSAMSVTVFAAVFAVTAVFVLFAVVSGVVVHAGPNVRKEEKKEGQKTHNNTHRPVITVARVRTWRGACAYGWSRGAGWGRLGLRIPRRLAEVSLSATASLGLSPPVPLGSLGNTGAKRQSGCRLAQPLYR